jgi:flagellin-like protein
MGDVMRSFRRSDRGLSEIVGTLMLVVIVVTAATLLAAFVASYQKQLQTEEAFSHDQSLESIHILGLTTELNPTGTNFTTFGFTLASEYINPSTVLGISINSNPLKNFSWKNLDNSATGYTTVGQNLGLAPFEELSVSTNLSWRSPAFSFFDNASVPRPDHYLKFDIYTVLQNDFSRVFLPPVPLEVVSEVNPSGGSNPSILLDGTASFQPEGNATLVQWNWTLENLTKSAPFLGPFYGEEAEFSASQLTPGDLYAVTLTVTNSDGLIGSTNLSYTAP